MGRPRTADRSADASIPEDAIAIVPRGRRRFRRPGERAWSNRFAAGSIEELRYARTYVAHLVVEYGEWILPIFERIDEECVRREARATSMDRVRQLAGAAR